MGATLAKRAYKCRFYPTEDQVQELLRTFGCIRLVYNKALEARTANVTVRATAYWLQRHVGDADRVEDH